MFHALLLDGMASGSRKSIGAVIFWLPPNKNRPPVFILAILLAFPFPSTKVTAA